MNADLRTVTVTIPQTDAGFFKKLSGNMGWKIVVAPRSKNRSAASSSISQYYNSPEFYHDLDAAEAAIAAGKGKVVETNQDLDALFV